MKKRERSKGNVGNEERKERKEREGGWEGKGREDGKGRKKVRKGLWPNKGPIQAVAWNDRRKLSASACLSADIHNQNSTVHTIRLSLHRDWLISQCYMEQ
jgi:hypothetical protein